MIHLEVHGAHIPALGFGTFQLPANTATYMVEAALEMGYRHIDTAQIYDTELNVGWGLRRSSIAREDYFVTTKVWVEPINSRRIAASVENSLRNLQTEYVDLLLLHWPTPAIPIAESLEAIAELQRNGKTRHIGISNYNCQQIEDACAASELPLLTNQVEYHAYLNQEKVLQTLRKHQMCLTAYSPLAQGRLLSDNTLVQIAETHNKTPSQVALRWLMQQGDVIAIPRSSNVQHADENIDIFDFKLSDAEMQSIHQLARKDGRVINPSHLAPDWD